MKKKIALRKPKFIGIKENNSVSEVYPSLPQTIENGFNISEFHLKKLLKLHCFSVTEMFLR